MAKSDLHGNAPDTAVAALLLIDVINDLEFDGGELLLPYALEAAERIRDLKSRAAEAGIPAIYVNDNFGRWRSDFREVVEHTLRDEVRGAEIAKLLQPEEADYFVLKPKHSAFFATTLQTLLKHLGVKKLILTGFAGDICILLSAADAYMRDYELYVPRDCIASEKSDRNEEALSYMERVLGATTTSSTQLDAAAIAAGEAAPETED
jgi:nicotinamidase-related amidase